MYSGKHLNTSFSSWVFSSVVLKIKKKTSFYRRNIFVRNEELRDINQIGCIDILLMFVLSMVDHIRTRKGTESTIGNRANVPEFSSILREK